MYYLKQISQYYDITQCIADFAYLTTQSEAKNMQIGNNGMIQAYVVHAVCIFDETGCSQFSREQSSIKPSSKQYSKGFGNIPGKSSVKPLLKNSNVITLENIAVEN